jgi:hypothetical protein
MSFLDEPSELEAHTISHSKPTQRFITFSKQARLRHNRRRWYTLISLFFAISISFFSQDSFLQWQTATAYAATQTQPLVHPNAANKYDAQAGTTSKVQPYKPAPKGNEPPHAPVTIQHNVAMPMQDKDVDLQAGKATTFLGSDGRLELDIAANAITATDVQQAGGMLRLHITQIAPASGSNAGGSGHFSLGTYLIQLVDAHGKLVNHGLRQPVMAKYHFSQNEKYLNLEHAYAILNGARPTAGTHVAATAQGVSVDQTFGKMQSQATKLDLNANVLSVSPMLSTPSSSMSFGGDASIGSFGKPDPFNVDLSGGGLTAGYSIDVPAGPGGLTPPVSLSYASEGVNEQHSPTGAVGWVGEGWNLSMGVINWSEHNVYAGN